MGENRLVSSFSNGYEVGHLGPKIPDVAFYPHAVARPSAGECVGFAEFKGTKWTGASAAEKGQIMQYGHQILGAQPRSPHVYGFVTNNAGIVLIRAEGDTQLPFRVFWSITAVLRSP